MNGEINMNSMTQLKGKKLLILAGGPNLISLVQRAKELGVYTIVTDYYDTETSPAKTIADEYWDISWNDIDQLEIKCLECGINGITTGYSETPVNACLELCERLNLPCYCTKEQLELTKDKNLFKEVCRENGVPVVREYSSIQEVKSYPIIIKPVDRAGSIGVSVATNYKELVKAYEYAMEKSYCKKVIIEDFISEGTKFDVTYAICGEAIQLLSDCDTINAKNNGFERVVQSGWLFPSKFHDYFMKKVDSAMRRMIKNLGIIDGYIFFSGFAIERGTDVDFVFFETGFRLSGGHMYNYINQKGIINVLDIFITHALMGNTELLSFEKDKKSDLKCVVVNYYAKDGIINETVGIDEIKSIPDCNFLLQLGKKGQECNSEHAILFKNTMIHFCNNSPELLAKDVEKANEVYSIIDTHGKDIVYDRIDGNIVRKWWKQREE